MLATLRKFKAAGRLAHVAWWSNDHDYTIRASREDWKRVTMHIPDSLADWIAESLNVSEEHMDTLYRLMWRERPDAVGTWDSLREWLAEKSWSVRRRTW